MIERVKEHSREFNILNDRLDFGNRSQVMVHAMSIHSKNNIDQWDTEVLSIRDSTQKRKIEEARLILDQKPTLNISKGITVIV